MVAPVRSRDPHVTSALEFEEWAREEPAKRAQAFTEAAEQWALAGDHQRAEELFLAAIADGGPVAGDARSFYSGFLSDAGRPERGRAVLDELWRSQPTEPATFMCAGEVCEVRGDLDAALRWFTAGLTRCFDDIDGLTPADVTPNLDLRMLLGSRSRVRAALGQPPDHWDRLAEAARRSWTSLLERIQRPQVAALYWPPSEFAELMARWPALTAEYGEHLDHRRSVETQLREHARLGMPGTVTVGSCHDLVAFLGTRSAEPPDTATRLEYAAHARAGGRPVAWPPGRNQPCWCSSGRKYKRCCGSPTFLS